MFHVEYVNVFVIFLHTKFHVPSASCSLVIPIKLKTKYRFCMTAMLFYIQQNKTSTNVTYFFLRSVTTPNFRTLHIVSCSP